MSFHKLWPKKASYTRAHNEHTTIHLSINIYLKNVLHVSRCITDLQHNQKYVTHFGKHNIDLDDGKANTEDVNKQVLCSTTKFHISCRDPTHKCLPCGKPKSEHWCSRENDFFSTSGSDLIPTLPVLPKHTGKDLISIKSKLQLKYYSASYPLCVFHSTSLIMYLLQNIKD